MVKLLSHFVLAVTSIVAISAIAEDQKDVTTQINTSLHKICTYISMQDSVCNRENDKKEAATNAKPYVAADFLEAVKESNACEDIFVIECESFMGLFSVVPN